LTNRPPASKFDFRSKHSTLASWGVRLGAWSVRNSTAVLVITALVTLAAIPLAVRVTYDDDVIQFLPEGDPQVARFLRIGERFQGLSIGLVGLHAESGDVFSLERLSALQRMAAKVRAVPGVSHCTAITEVRDVAEETADNGERMAVVADLVGALPAKGSDGAAEFSAEIRARVLSRPHIAGALVSADGKSTLLLAHLDPKARQKDTANGVRAAVEAVLAEPGLGLQGYFGGAPFIGAYVSDGAQRDLKRLSPWVAFAICFIVLVTSRSVSASVVALGTVGVGVAWLMGAMGALGRPLTLVSSSLPVLLVALGSAYSIHLLSRILSLRDTGETDRQKAALTAVSDVGPPIFLAGITTAIGFISFLAMDIRPMREFGLWMSAGTVLVVLLALIVVPAAAVRLPLRPRSEGRAPEGVLRAFARSSSAITRHPRISLLTCSLLVVVASFYTAKVDTHMETRAFFAEDSEPVLAENFLEQRLGGSLFLQIEVTGDAKTPAVMAQIDRLATLASAQPGVTGVQSIADPVALAAGAMTGRAALPASPTTARAVAALVDDDPNMRLLVDAAWQHALVTVRLGGFNTRTASAIAATIEGLALQHIAGPRVQVPRSALSPQARAAELDDVALFTHLALSQAPNPPTLEAVRSALAAPASGTVREALAPALKAAIEDDELLYLAENATLEQATTAAVEVFSAAQPPTVEALRQALDPLVAASEKEDSEEYLSALRYIHGNLSAAATDALKKARTGAVLALAPGELPAAVAVRVARMVGALDEPQAIVAASFAPAEFASQSENVGVEVSGYPMVYAGMNESVSRNQTFSLLLASALVLLSLVWFFRSFAYGLAASIPAGMTLMVTFGTMGALGIPMDVGTSMISSIALGTGLDYGIHLLWHHGASEASSDGANSQQALATTGWSIVINALEVGVGFAILALGTMVPMQTFGALTAMAMLVSAALTILLIPGLAAAVARLRREPSPTQAHAALAAKEKNT
jgi:predicted RND superfamily exporter protein